MSSSYRLNVTLETLARESGTCHPIRKPGSRHSCCLIPYGPPPDKPDLAIYSQEEQFSLGNAPTWDSPDILTNFWKPFHLMPESQVTVRNLSATVTAANTQILFYTAVFGIGQPRTLLASQIVTLAPVQKINLSFPLPQNLLNAADQRIATHVKIVHPYDAKLINNEGAQLLADAYTSQMGRSFIVHFPVLNPVSVSQQLTLAAMPNLLSAVVSPAAQVFAPLQQITATLAIEVPSSLHGTSTAPERRDVTIVGRDVTGNLLGGVTYVIWVDD